jgi:hypothetical protein
VWLLDAVAVVLVVAAGVATNQILNNGNWASMAWGWLVADLALAGAAAVVTHKASMARAARADLGGNASPIVAMDFYRERLRSTVPGFEADLRGGREAITAVRDWAAGSGPRVMVIEAPGGIGKTRNVLEALRSNALVLQPGASLTETTAGTLPTEVSTVLFLDDAHKAGDLSGLIALLADLRFAAVRVALATRPGLVGAVLNRINVPSDSVGFIKLARLGRAEIDAIVTGYGIQNPEFRAFVIRLAEGNPLIAHTAASVAVKEGVFTQQSVDQVMTRYLRSRLEPVNDRNLHDGHLSVAVAIALLTSGSSEDILRLAGTVRGLPTTLVQVDALVDDLADRGLVSGPAFVLRPDLAAPALLAMALYPQMPYGVGLDKRRLTVRGALSSLMGELPCPTTFLATQLGVLAQVVSTHERDLADVVRAVESLVPENLNALDAGDYWIDLFAVGGAVARFSPSLMDRLTLELAHHWPVASSEATAPGEATNHDVLRAAADAAGAIAQEDEDSLIYAVSSLVTLCALSSAAGPGANDHVREVLTTLADASGRPDMAAAARRTTLRVLTQQWKATSPQAERGDWLARLILHSLPSLTAPTVEHRQFGTVNSAMELSISADVLPVGEISREIFSLAADLAVDILDQPPTPAIAASTIECLHEMRRKRPLGFPFGGGALPERLVDLLEGTAGQLEQKLAVHWSSLSLSARYRAVRVIIELPRRGAERTLEAQRSAGSAIAAAALEDTAISAFMTIFPARPVDVSLATTEHLTAEAAGLAGSIEIDSAFSLLEDPACAERIGHWPPGPLWSFGRVLGRRMGSAAVLERTTACLEATAPQNAFWLPYVALGALENSDDAGLWIERLHEAHGAEGLALVVLPVASDLPESVERSLIDILVEAETLTGTIVRPLALHLYRSSRLTTAEKMDLLRQLGKNGRGEALGETTRYLGYLAENQEQAGWLCEALQRHLIEGPVDPDTTHDPDIGIALQKLGQIAPDLLARFFVEWRTKVIGSRTLGLYLLPHGWESLLRDLPRGAREIVTAALLEQLCSSTTRCLRGEEAELIYFFGHDTNVLLQQVKQWEANGAPSRDHVLSFLARAWSRPEYGEIAGRVIASGLTLDQYSRLQLSLRPRLIGAGAPEEVAGIRTALVPLKSHASPRVRDFVKNALDALDQAERNEAERTDRDTRGYT